MKLLSAAGRSPGAAWDEFAERVAAGTPSGRDRGADALRALAIIGVIAGHWLVTAWMIDAAGHVRVASPLTYMPGLTPASWVFQTLAVFFFVGGYAADRSLARTADARRWLLGRTRRLLVPVGPLLLAWVLLLLPLAGAGLPVGSLRSIATPALGPLWFLLVFGLLTAATPLLSKARPLPLACVLVALVLVVDVVRFGLGGPGWLGWENLATGWAVPYVLGIAWARGALAGRRVAAAMLAGGAAGTALLVLVFGYPASMVGVTGARVSNLSPPTLAAVCFGVAQIGLALLLHRPLTALMRRPRVWAAVVVANLSAMTVFLWHQTALTVIMLAGLPFGSAPGLLARPDSVTWLLQRLSWLPLAAALVALACVYFSRRDRSATRQGRLNHAP
ncbi:acyltransferase family protein [Sphaerisporangium fuscum]|uniref:acyltransferase family protein n=1 Tax=Sphaerisporangium fuscum TaxID=2835868 RepID=UPI001BDD75AB|nr:acyltransferase [Sphaerisporangium fuscum]